jgi:peptidoglycan/LPS O-acetylase OafA/YrhL
VERGGAGSSIQPRVFYPELESLRGVAAMCVLILHATLVTLSTDWSFYGPADIDRLGWPLYLVAQGSVVVFNGRAAVVMFFVLSGFVMSFGFGASKRLNAQLYFGFLIRRFFRLMPALWAALVLALIINPDLHRNLRSMEQYALLKDLSFDSVAWTLVIEIAICFIYPFMATAAALLSVGVQALVIVFLAWSFRNAPEIHYYLCRAPAPILAFSLGLAVPTLGKLAVQLTDRLSPLGPLLAILAMMSQEIARWYASFDQRAAFAVEYCTIFLPFGSFYIISWLLFGRHRVVADLLRRDSIAAIGRWSYGIYLFHLPIIFAICREVDAINSPSVRVSIVIVTTIAATLPIAAISFRWIETPCIAIGRRLTDLITAWLNPLVNLPTNRFVSRVSLAPVRAADPFRASRID